MSESKKPPFTAEEMQEILRSGDFKIVFAESSLVDHYEKQVRLIKIAVAKWMGSEEDPERWADSAFLTDMTTFDDFGLDEDELALVSAEVGIGIKGEDYVYAIAARMAGAN